jgi:hypothetical protein
LRNRCLWMATLVAGIAPGCPAEEVGSDQSTIQFALTSSTFSGASVRICGTRPAAGPQFTCESSLPSTPGEPASCVCFDFDENGSLIDANGDPAIVGGLCPSSVPPSGDWTFDYAVFDRRGCEGTQLNDGTDFVCYDANDLATRAHPNQSVEPLQPGLNTNHIICAVKTASKTWDFTSCADITTPEDMAARLTRYDCGCTPTDSGMCDCGEGGLSALDLETGCSFDSVCDIVCDEC